MADKGLVSIIVPVYNAEKYLRACLESLLCQTYKSIEIILVDDGSSDGSGEICKEYASNHNNVNYILQDNGGASRARNTGLTAARGEYIGFCDADDTVEADMYEYLVKGMEEHSADIAQCGVYFDTGDTFELMYTPKKPIIMPEGIESADGGFFRYLAPSTWSKLYREERIGALRYDPEFIIGEDLRYNLFALSTARRAVLLPEPKYHYIQRPTSLCYTGSSPERITSYRRMLLTTIRELVHSPTLLRYMRERLLVGDCDLASKAVNLGVGTEDVLRTLGKEVRGNLCFLIFRARIPLREKLKLLLIGYTPRLYKRLVRKA